MLSSTYCALLKKSDKPSVEYPTYSLKEVLPHKILLDSSFILSGQVKNSQWRSEQPQQDCNVLCWILSFIQCLEIPYNADSICLCLLDIDMVLL